MKRKAISSLLCVLAILQMSVTPAYATNITQQTSTPGNQSATITYDQGSKFTVTIPKTIALGSNKSVEYTVKVEGDISGNETITITPDSTITLNDADGKDAVTGNIEQTKTEFNSTEVNQADGVSTTGTITANDLTAGDWSGNFEFAINVNKELIAGLYDADGKMVCTWEESGIDVSKDYTMDSYKTDPASAHSVLKTKPEVKSIVIPNSVTNIGGYAFYDCLGLTSITIPDSVTSIGNYAFGVCSSLTSITIPDSVTNIGEWAFSSCFMLTSIIIPDSVTNIGRSAFCWCSGLTSITIPDSVTNIGEWAFDHCSSLTSITIPNSVTSIGRSAFSSCSNLASVTYKGQIYTSISALTTALKNNNVTVETKAFNGTKLQ